MEGKIRSGTAWNQVKPALRGRNLSLRLMTQVRVSGRAVTLKKLGIDQTTAWLFAVFLSLCIFGGIYFLLSSIAKNSSDSMMEYLDEQEIRKDNTTGDAGDDLEDQDSEEGVRQDEEETHGRTGGSGLQDDVSWGYSGKNGPENWGRLSDNFLDCRVGRQQSPVDLNSPVPDGELSRLRFAYEETYTNLRNNGRTIAGDYSPGSDLIAGNQVYHLREFHFHVPSEHTVDGIPYDMEMHLVHQNDEGKLAYVGVFMEEGRKVNRKLNQIWMDLPDTPGRSGKKFRFNIKELLPAKRQYFMYEGSLTSPPCGEGVRWYLLKKPVMVSSGQIDRFIRIFRHNSRPVQSIHKRTIRISRLN